MTNKKVSIYWTRHAESCSNLDMQALDDKIPVKYEDHIGYDYLINSPDKFVSRSFGLDLIKGAFRAVSTHPNLTCVGMQHAILLGNYFKNLSKGIDVVFVSPTIRTIMTALIAFRSNENLKKIIYVVPFITENINIVGSFDITNTPLKSSQLKRMIPFIKEWLHTEWINNFDDIEIINNLISLREYFQNNKDNRGNKDNGDVETIVRHIESILTCKPGNYKSRKDTLTCDNDKKNTSTHTKTAISGLGNSKCAYLSDLQTLSKLLQTYCDSINCGNRPYDENLVKYFKMFESHTDLKTYFEGPMVNFDILDYFESSGKQLYPTQYYHDIVPYFNRFYTEILGAIQDGNDLGLDSTSAEDIRGSLSQSDPNICVVTHGLSMRTYFHRKYGGEFHHAIRNTQIYSETFSNLSDYSRGAIEISDLKNIGKYGESNPDSHINYEAYVPHDIRSIFKNFEYLNDNVCQMESLRGVINYALWEDTNKTTKVIDGSKYTCDMVKTSQNIKQIGGGKYYYKYLAAKRRYYKLKKFSYHI